MDFWSRFSEYGLLGLMIGSMILLLFFIVKWVLEHTRELLMQQAKERECWQNIIGKHNEFLQKIVDSIDKHDEKADERGKYIRFEHEKMINNLDEQSKMLARINGFKHG